jgi:hypothetical protein
MSSKWLKREKSLGFCGPRPKNGKTALSRGAIQSIAPDEDALAWG